MFNTLITGPLGWILSSIYYVVRNYGLAIICFCLVIKVILFPFTLKSKRATFANARLQPKMQELQKKYKNDKEKYSLELQKLYKEEKASPLSGCLPTLITLPILFGLYYVVTQPLTYLMKFSTEVVVKIADALQKVGITDPTALEKFANVVKTGKSNVSVEIIMADYASQFADKLRGIVPELEGKEFFNFGFLGLNLSHTPTYHFSDPGFSWGLLVLLVVSVGTSFLSGWLMQKWNPMTSAANADPNMQSAQSSTKMMLYIAPVMTLFIGFSVPAAVSLYWITNNVLTILSDLLANRIAKKKEEAIVQAKAEADARKKRNKKKAAEIDAAEGKSFAEEEAKEEKKE